MNFPYQRAYWTRRRVWLLVGFAVVAVFGGIRPQGVFDLLGLLTGLVLYTVLLISIYHGLRKAKEHVW